MSSSRRNRFLSDPFVGAGFDDRRGAFGNPHNPAHGSTEQSLTKTLLVLLSGDMISHTTLGGVPILPGEEREFVIVSGDVPAFRAYFMFLRAFVASDLSIVCGRALPLFVVSARIGPMGLRHTPEDISHGTHRCGFLPVDWPSFAFCSNELLLKVRNTNEVPVHGFVDLIGEAAT